MKGKLENLNFCSKKKFSLGLVHLSIVMKSIHRNTRTFTQIYNRHYEIKMLIVYLAVATELFNKIG